MPKLKKLFGLFFALVLVAGMLPSATAFAEEPKQTTTEIQNDISNSEEDNSSSGDTSLPPEPEKPSATYTIKFDKNNDKAVGEMPAQKVKVDDYVQISANTFNWEKCRFACWNTKPDGSGDTYNDQSFVENLAPENGEITLYAQWDVTIFYGYLDNDGPGGAILPPFGEVEGPPANDFVRYGTPYYSINIPNTSDKYIFHGWFTDSSFTNKYVEGSIITEPIHLEGKWTCSKRELNVDYKFVSKDGTTPLPEEVLNQCPASHKTNQCETVRIPNGLVLTNINTSDGTWSFTGWDKTEVANVSEDVLFVGTWDFVKSTPSTNEAPVINASDKVITVDDNFNPLSGVTAYDKEDGDITNKLEVVKNTVNTKKAGTYEVVFKVGDKNGSIISKTIKVTVKEKEVVPPKPTPTPTPNNPVNPTPSSPATPPDTGDNSNGTAWLFTTLAALAGLSATICYKYKRNKK